MLESKFMNYSGVKNDVAKCLFQKKVDITFFFCIFRENCFSIKLYENSGGKNDFDGSANS